jgi:hypothetical protein
VAVIDATTLPATSALRLRLTSQANTWQSISEVDVWGDASAVNVCRGGDASVSASFHQTKWATMPASNACDGRLGTAWSTWTDAGYQDSATFTMETSEIHRLNEVRFTNIEGSIAGVSLEYRDPHGNEWKPLPLTGGAPTVTNGVETTLSFPKILATGLRLTFSTPGSYLKIPEIVMPEAGGIAHIEPVLPTQPNAAGWYATPPGPISLSHDGNTDVEVQYRVDGGDWQTGTTFDITPDGDHSVDYRALWNGAEVPEVAGSLPVRIDTVAPTTDATVAKPSTLLRLVQPAAVFEALAPAEATVEFSATDATSGVALTEYSLDGVTWAAGSAVTLTGAGDHVVRFRSTDVAGNVEPAQSATVTVVAGAAPGDGDGSGTGSGTSGASAGTIGGPGSPSGGTAGGLAVTGSAAPVSLGILALVLAGLGAVLLGARRRRRA